MIYDIKAAERVPWNSILNPEWYQRLRRGVTSDIVTNIMRTRSEWEDPYWRAVEAEKLEDLQKQQAEARTKHQETIKKMKRHNLEVGLAARARENEREKTRQRIISRALAGQEQLYFDPSQVISGMTEQPELPGVPEAPGIPDESAFNPYEAAPSAYVPGQVEEMRGNAGMGGPADIGPGAVEYTPWSMRKKRKPDRRTIPRPRPVY